jgi:hypothetical protein
MAPEFPADCSVKLGRSLLPVQQTARSALLSHALQKEKICLFMTLDKEAQRCSGLQRHDAVMKMSQLLQSGRMDGRAHGYNDIISLSL